MNIKALILMLFASVLNWHMSVMTADVLIHSVFN